MEIIKASNYMTPGAFIENMGVAKWDRSMIDLLVANAVELNMDYQALLLKLDAPSMDNYMADLNAWRAHYPLLVLTYRHFPQYASVYFNNGLVYKSTKGDVTVNTVDLDWLDVLIGEYANLYQRYEDLRGKQKS